MSSSLQQRNEGKTKAKEDYDPLSVLNENGEAEPLDDQEQEAVIKALRDSNEKSNYIYRGLMLVILSLTGVLYLSPIPDYIQGTHPESHLTMFFGPSHLDGSHEDLIKLPAFPLYLVFLSIQGTFLFGAFYETLNRMGHTTIKGMPYPQQPHLFGTCPNFLAPFLSEIRWHPSHMGVRADTPDYQAPPVTATMPPRLLYLSLIALASLPLPLMTFGAGSFVNAGWWAITFIVLVALVACELMINKFEKEAFGLNGLRYGYKGA